MPFLAQGGTYRAAADQFVRETLLARLTQIQHLTARQRLIHTEEYLRRAYDYQESELASARKRFSEKAREGDKRAGAELERIKTQQRSLSERRDLAIAQARREVELIAAGKVEIIATALVQPSNDIEDVRARDAEVERIAMEIAIAHEASVGADVRDVSTPNKAHVAGLTDYPGFDVLSRRAPEDERAIEVKGRVGTGDVELTENEWAKAINLRERYWLYVVFDCGTPEPRLFRIADPFGKLLAKSKATMIINARELMDAALREER